ncbi:hypothetical protein [uncultured Roseovarius sp.]|nr:hypothetical protein [uncultured Roseovarius sp.]
MAEFYSAVDRWKDGAPDEGGRHPGNSSYAAWWATLDKTRREYGEGG